MGRGADYYRAACRGACGNAVVSVLLYEEKVTFGERARFAGNRFADNLAFPCVIRLCAMRGRFFGRRTRKIAWFEPAFTLEFALI